MTKAYWVAIYHAVHDPDALARYADRAGPAVAAGGGRILARGLPADVREAGRRQRLVVVEFDSVAAAQACYDSPAYQEAVAHLANGAVEREIRIVEAV